VTKLDELAARWRRLAESAEPFEDSVYLGCADDLEAEIAEQGWRPPPDAGICADDLDECTITLALSSEDEVRAARAALPLRHRVRVMPDTHLLDAPGTAEVTEAAVEAGAAAMFEAHWNDRGRPPPPWHMVGDADYWRHMSRAAIEAADRARGLRP
jgi:hypothetical protein